VDTTGEAMRRAEEVVRSLYTIAGQMNAKERQAMSKFLKQSDSHAGFSNMLAIARNKATFAVTIDDLDKNPWLLGVGNLTIELRDGRIRESRQEDLITKSAGAEYDLKAQCPQWLKFLNEIFQGDQELIAYIQRAFGYSLTGSMAEQVFFYCYGTGANGKSVFLAILRAMLGDYAKQADFSTFLVQRNENVRNDLAALAGARVVVAIEAEEGRRLSMPIIKAWTGGDPVTTRFLFAEFFTYKPEGKLWFAANNKLRITERNIAAWRRPQLIPFNVTIAK
jgi:putative DNA primase/helicase